MSDPGFVCVACGKDYEGDTTNVMTECKVCERLHCSECVDELADALSALKPNQTKVEA